MPHRVSRDHAMMVINTVYVVFLGILFTGILRITPSVSGVDVQFIFSSVSSAGCVLCGTLLVYFLFDWAIWQALVRHSDSVLDLTLLVNVGAVIALALTFNFGLSVSPESLPVAYPMFAVYALVGVRDDLFIIRRYHKSARDGRIPIDGAAGVSGMALLVYVPFVLKLLAALALMLFSLILATLPRDIKDVREPLMQVLVGIIVGYTSLKALQYIIFTRLETPKRTIFR